MLALKQVGCLLMAGGAGLLIGCSGAGGVDEESTEEVGQSLTKADGGSVCDVDYCDSGSCGLGEGDCDSHSQCLPGLLCGKNNGILSGCATGVDLCVQCPGFVLGLDNREFCHPNCPCAQGEGDCDTDADCEGALVCVDNVGDLYGMSPTYDICELPTFCPPWDAAADNRDFCTPGCPCAQGQGDCDADADCAGPLVCVDNIGALYGLNATYDVCEDAAFCPPWDPAADNRSFCSAACPCTQGQGDCDSNAGCATGLDCINNLGANYGLNAGYDVCEVCLDNPGIGVPYAAFAGSTVGLPDRRSPACGYDAAGTPDMTFEINIPADGVYRFSLVGSSFDTMLALYDGDCNGPEIGCNDDPVAAGGLQSIMQAELSAGQTVVALVTGYNGDTGDVVLEIREVFPCCTATPGVPGCGGGPVEAAIEACVCSSVDTCCTTEWNDTCTDLVGLLGCGKACPAQEVNPCCYYSGSAGCPPDPAIEACVCAIDSFCCGTAWDWICQDEVESDCGGYCGP